MNGTTAEKGITVWNSQSKSSALAEAVTSHFESDIGASDRQRSSNANRYKSSPFDGYEAVSHEESDTESFVVHLGEEPPTVIRPSEVMYTQTEVDVMQTVHYEKTVESAFERRVLNNAAFFVLGSIRPLMDPAFVQVHVHGPFVSSHKGGGSRKISDTHYYNDRTIAHLLVGSHLRLPPSLNASMNGKPLRNGSVVSTDWDGLDLHILVSGLGGKRKKKGPPARIAGRGGYGEAVMAAGAESAVKLAGGVAGKIALDVATLLAKKAQKATLKTRVAAGKKIAKFVEKAHSYLGNRMSRLVGRGDYTIAGNTTVVNSLMKGSNLNAYSSFGGDCAGMIIEHREFIGDLATGVIVTGAPELSTFPFNIQVIEINAGLVASFPWLAQIALNYEEYKFLGLVLEFVSTTSPYNSQSAMGEVIITSQDNVTAPPYTTRSQLFNSEMSTAGRVDKNMMYGVECKNPAVPWYQVRSDTSTTPLNLTDPVKMYIATSVASTFPQNSILGEVWITYRCQFRGPILKPALSSSVIAVFPTMEVASAVTPGMFGTTNDASGSIQATGRFASGSTIQTIFNQYGIANVGGTATNSPYTGHIRLPSGVAGEVFKITLTWTRSLNVTPSLANVLLPTPSLTRCVYYVPDTVTGAYASPLNDTVPISVTQPATSSYYTWVQSFYVQATSPNPIVVLTWPTFTGSSVGGLNWPVASSSPGISASGNSSLVADIQFVGTFQPSVFSKTTVSTQLATFFKSTPLFTNAGGNSTAVGQFAPPVLVN